MIIVPFGSGTPSLPSPTRPSRFAAQGSGDRVELGGTRPAEAPPAPAAARLRGRFEVDGAEGRPMEPGTPASWTFRFQDAEGRPVTSFEPEHEKPMHLVAVSADLERFAHLHPALGPDGGFRLLANQPSCDPDNADAAGAVAKAGAHHLFATVRPAGGESELHRFDLQASGEPAPVALVPDPQIRPGTIRKYFDRAGREGGPGAAYEATLAISDHRRHGMFQLELHLRQAVADGSGGVEYRDVRDAEPWLGAPGHAVLIGAAGQRAEDRFFSHLHAGGGHGDHPAAAPSGAPLVWTDGEHPPGGGGDLGPTFRFAAPAEELAPDGLYKTWIQVRQGGQVRTFPFAFRLA